jgi:NhaA family Na+:H+ antiporter
MRAEDAKVGVLVGTLTAALLAAVLLRMRNRRYQRIEAEERRDADLDGVPDVYQQGGADRS